MTNDEMMRMSYPYPSDRPRMSRVERAAQFSPFAALTGFDGVVQETARLTEERPEMSEEQKAAIDKALAELLRRIEEKPEAEIVFFQPDARKAGGGYAKKRGAVRRIDEVNRVICFTDGERIEIGAIVRLQITRKSG